VPVIRKYVPKAAPFLPSAMAVGIAFIIPAFFSFPFLFGALAHLVWKWRSPGSAADLGFAVASGVLVGSGLAYVGTAVFDALKLDRLVELPH
jgi:uncharacterized oligopeptide transporter (OPT) family protein